MSIGNWRVIEGARCEIVYRSRIYPPNYGAMRRITPFRQSATPYAAQTNPAYYYVITDLRPIWNARRFQEWGGPYDANDNGFFCFANRAQNAE